jgi:alkanesulfonate monooxygenase SsuD/methylene tetrahydromethanopterin reductase-like flavin-dependent oxidoreductase (luciferase family)
MFLWILSTSQHDVTFKGKYYQVKNSNLYTKSLRLIPIFVAEIGPRSARLAGREAADGFVTNEANPVKAIFRGELSWPAQDRGECTSGGNGHNRKDDASSF